MFATNDLLLFVFLRCKLNHVIKYGIFSVVKKIDRQFQ